MEIRRSDPRDLEPFAEINLAWIAELNRVEPVDEQMCDHPEQYMQDGNSVFAAIVNERTAGVVALKKNDAEQWELAKMAVDREFRGRGIGNALLEHVEHFARHEMGICRIYLLSSTVNAAAIRLYQRRGWIVNHEGPHPKYARCNIGMFKRLDA